MQLSASSAALDLALSQSPGPEAQSNGWAAFPSRHRPTQSQTNMSITAQSNGAGSGSTLTNGPESPISVRPYSSRHSLDLKYYDSQENPSQVSSPKNSVLSTPPKLQSSYSANDVPTMRPSTNGVPNINTTPNSHAQQHLHNHNASLGRIPPNGLNNRLSQNMSSPTDMSPSQNGGFPSIQSALQSSAPPFGPSLTQGTSQVQSPVNMTAQSPQSPYGGAYNYNYNMQMMTMGMQNMGIGQPQLYSPNNPYAYQAMQQPMYSPGPVAVAPQQRDSQARVIQQRRQTDGEGKPPPSPFSHHTLLT